MKILFFLCCLLPVVAAAQPRAEYDVCYSPHLASEGLVVQASVRTPKPEDSTAFRFSNEVWGEHDLMRCLSGFRGENAQYRFRMVPDSNRIVVYHPRTKSVRFAYRVNRTHPSTRKTSSTARASRIPIFTCSAKRCL
ncbi:hypothetical protein [Hymenobacter jejuensis]|uniref:Uncharacterized protein n=1 Tax=Hymenobacter jejuensis TaxID=2502781 RepID=A0A5B8A414_9BACT|nr:hypothetical protein [Hymenobacter jejuensis]QDA62100.1 hypothetical protein FHG12_19230 [Hymenobacter jejuensis]